MKKLMGMMLWIATSFVFLIGCTQCTSINYNEYLNKNATRIFEIQGEGHTSAYNQKYVENVYGIVTGITVKGKDKNGFYIQDPVGDKNIKTSDGIYVYAKGKVPDSLEKGDFVKLSGIVQEYAYDSSQLTNTQIALQSKKDVVTIYKNCTLPPPVEIKYSDLNKDVFIDNLDALEPTTELLDFFESLEYMRVKVKNPKVPAAPYKSTNYIIPADAPQNIFTPAGGVISNSYKNTGTVCIAPKKCFDVQGEIKHKPLNADDTFKGDVIGVIGYAYSNYQIEITEKLPPVKRGNLQPEISKINFEKNYLNVLSYNVYNFSNSDTKRINGKLRSQIFAEHFINTCKAPDIICLIEIQDDDGKNDTGNTSAQKTLEALIKKMKQIDASKPYAYVDIAPENKIDGGIPGGNIRCSYIYRVDRLQLIKDKDGSFTNSTNDSVAKITDGGNSLIQNPARLGVNSENFKNTRKSIVAHFKFLENNKDFFIINNHFSSKRGDQPTFGKKQPAKRKTEVKRHGQADEVINFIKTIQKARPNVTIISTGDYNDFWFSETLNKFKNIGMQNVIEELPLNERYTYVYNGNSQTLDHILVMNAKIKYADILNINSDFNYKIRPSDHDPVFVQLEF